MIHCCLNRKALLVREKLLMNLLIFLSDFLASPEELVYSCVFKLLAGKACFREYDCKYDKGNNYFRVPFC